MKKKLFYVLLVVVCIGLSSFKNACGGTDNTGIKKTDSKKTCHVHRTAEVELAPLYNLLVI